MGGCRPSEISTGPVKRGNNGLGTTWARCPLVVGNRIAEIGRIQVGWAMARVQILETRPFQCFRCLEGGHVKATCTGIDRSARCYRCGDSGHKAQNCSAKPCCPDLRRPAGHRAGEKACLLANRRGGRSSGGPFKIPLPPPKATGDPQSEGASTPRARRRSLSGARNTPIGSPAIGGMGSIKVVEDITYIEADPLSQRVRRSRSRQSLRPSSAMSVAREGAEDPDASVSLRDA